jgi:hypothetical protein
MRREAASDAIDHVGRRLLTLKQCALHRRTIRLTCPACGHIRLIDAIPLWWLFAKRGWDDGLPEAMARLCCLHCRNGGRVVRPRYLVTRDYSEGPQPPYPTAAEWKKVVSRYRS